MAVLHWGPGLLRVLAFRGNTAAANNRAYVKSSIAGSPVEIGVDDDSTDTNVDLILRPKGTGIIDVRDDDNADQGIFLTPEFGSATDYQRGGIQTNTITLSGLSGASAVTSGLVPAGKLLLGITGRVETLVEGATSFNVGDGSDADRFGAAIGLTAGTVIDDSDYTATGFGFSASAQEVTLTAVGSNFTAGAVTLCAYYVSMEAD